jgi:hypothetical protein
MKVIIFSLIYEKLITFNFLIYHFLALYLTRISTEHKMFEPTLMIFLNLLVILVILRMFFSDFHEYYYNNYFKIR